MEATAAGLRRDSVVAASGTRNLDLSREDGDPEVLVVACPSRECGATATTPTASIGAWGVAIPRAAALDTEEASRVGNGVVSKEVGTEAEP